MTVVYSVKMLSEPGLLCVTVCHSQLCSSSKLSLPYGLQDCDEVGR